MDNKDDKKIKNIFNKINETMDNDCIDDYGFRVKSPKNVIVIQDIKS